jgi:methylase of polypeptide subunit release factors
VPARGLLVAHDPEEDAPVAADHVLGVGGSTNTLAALTVRRPVEAALDMGTGSGLQALLAAAHTERVVGVDLNPRAIHYARLNAKLNEIANVEFRQGDLFEPVSGDRFDLVVANPPYVVSPDSEYVYRDSGERGDAISRAVVAGTAETLREGGYATILCNWVHRLDESWDAPLRVWLESSGCDAWLLNHVSDDPATYAVRWNQLEQRRDADEFTSTLARWRSYYLREGIEAIATGAVILRKRAGPNWVRADRMPLPPSGDAGAHILRVFAAQDNPLDEARILSERLAFVDGHRLQQTLLYRSGDYAVEDAHLLLEEGVGVPAQVAVHAVHVLLTLDGVRRLDELIDEAATLTGIDRAVLARDAVSTALRLYELGFVVRAASL